MARSSTAVKTFICVEHGRDLADKYELFYQQQQMFDVTLIAEDDNISLRAHRTFLSASSDYFRQRFTSTESDASELQLSNMNGNTLKSILDFIYTGSIELNTDTIKNVLVAADLLKMKTLIAACLDFIGEQLNTRNCLDCAQYAEQHHHTPLETKSMAYAYQHFEEVCTKQAFLFLNEIRLNNFLSGYDQYEEPSQEKLFESLVAWYKHNEVRREEAFCRLLSRHVRFPILDIKFIEENRNKLSGITEYSELMSSWLEWHISAEIQKKTTQKIFFMYTDCIDCTFSVQSYNPELNRCSVKKTRNRNAYSVCVFNKTLINFTFENRDQYFDHCDGHCMIELNENLYVFGGRDRNGRWLTLVKKYDFSEYTWQNVASLPEEIDFGKATVLNGLIYVSFGDIQKYYLQRYDPRTNKWSQTPPKNVKVTRFGIIPLRGNLYAIGGQNNLNQSSRSVERYDPTNNKWTEIKSLETGRHNIVCTTWNDRILACGGVQDDGTYTNELNEYNPLLKTWTNLAPFLCTGPNIPGNSHLTTME